MISKKLFETFYLTNLSNMILTAACILAFLIPLTNGKLIIPILLLFLLWVFEGNFQEKAYKLLNCNLFLLFLAFIFFSTLSLLWSNYLAIGLKSINPFHYYLLIIPIILTSIQKEKIFYIINAFIYGMAVHIALYYLSHLTGWTPKHPFYTPYTIYAPLTAFSALFFLNRFIMSQKNGLDYFHFALFVFFASFLFMHDGRSAQIGFLVTVVLYAFLIQKHIYKTLAATTLLIASTIILTLFFAPSTVEKYHEAYLDIKRTVEQQQFNGSWSWRAGAYLTSFYVIAEHPLIGTGIGDSQDEYQRVIARGTSQPLYSVAWMDSPHNEYLGLLMKIGLIGILPFLMFIIMFYRLSIENKELKRLSFIFMTLACISMLFDESLQMKPYNIYFALMIALFMTSATTSYKYNDSQGN